MAWPPPTLPTNRTNATPQQDTHPNDHNALALAMNDTVAQVVTLNANTASLKNAQPRAYHGLYTGEIPMTAGSWFRVQTPAQSFLNTGTYLVLCIATMYSVPSGQQQLRLGMDGVMQATAPAAISTVAGMRNVLSCQAVYPSVTAGAHVLEAYGFTDGASGGGIGSVSIVATQLNTP